VFRLKEFTMSLFNKLNTGPARLMLAALVFAGAGAFVVTAEAAPADAAAEHQLGGGPGMDGGGHGGMGGMGMHGGPRQLEHMLDGINATPDQRTQIKAILQTAMNDLKPQREAGKALHEQMRQAFTQPTVDARVVESLRAQQAALHDAAGKRMLQAKLEISRVLTPEQRKLMADRMAKRQSMMERHRAERAALEPGRK
jgi:periplasmic protein CpxP/Spy